MSELKKVGALWLKIKEGKKTFMSGELELVEGEKIRVFVFKNDGEGHVRGKHPDYTINIPVEESEAPKQAQVDLDKQDSEIPF